MQIRRFSSLREQVAGYVEEEIGRGRWVGVMPGRDVLARELGVNRKTVEAVLKLLEERGVLEGKGNGRRRRIAVEVAAKEKRVMRVGLLLFELGDRSTPYIIQMLHRLEEAGHVAFFGSRTLADLKQDAVRVAKFVRETEADAWVVLGGGWEVLAWFHRSGIQVFALFGRWRAFPIAGGGPDKIPAFVEVVRRLVGLGHQRIVMLARREHRLPQPGPSMQAYLDELSACGIAAGVYNLPEWEESPEGLLAKLNQIFKITPPTAMIVDDPFLYLVTQQHLARRGIHCPQDVSLVCCDPHPMFEWMRPQVAYIEWKPDELVKGIVKWVNRVAAGRKDVSRRVVKAEFIEGGTIGGVNFEF